jgi:D-alanine transaminase/branched-chain amino acid aminotransferase
VSSLFLYINNQFLPATDGSLPVSDLSIQRGYALFDYLKVVNGIPLYVDDHLDRLFHSAEQLHLPIIHTREALKDIIRQLMQHNHQPHSGIRITLTGGNSPDGYSIAAPNLIISQSPLQLPTPEAVERGIKLMTFPHQRQLPHVKTTDYIMAIWLQPQVKEQGADDILYYNEASITECPRANIFIVKEGKLITPAQNILKGVIRKHILELAADLLQVEERYIPLQELKLAEEVFITSTTKQVLPVRQVDEVVLFKEGPGRITTQLLHLLQEQQAAQYKQAATV